MMRPSVVVEAAGILVIQDKPMTAAEARHVALRLLEAATTPVRGLRRPAVVDEGFQAREGGG